MKDKTNNIFKEILKKSSEGLGCERLVYADKVFNHGYNVIHLRKTAKYTYVNKRPLSLEEIKEMVLIYKEELSDLGDWSDFSNTSKYNQNYVLVKFVRFSKLSLKGWYNIMEVLIRYDNLVENFHIKPGYLTRIKTNE